MKSISVQWDGCVPLYGNSKTAQCGCTNFKPFSCGHPEDSFPIGSPNSANLLCLSQKVVHPSFACYRHMEMQLGFKLLSRTL